jgi:hypothetical protein
MAMQRLGEEQDTPSIVLPASIWTGADQWSPS